MPKKEEKYIRVSRNYRYCIWLNMVSRCTKAEHKAWKWYGARGLAVCDRWLNSFEAFVDDMGDRPSKFHSLDRINNQLGYSPDNCRWATSREQALNRRPPATRPGIKIDGLSFAALSELHGINRKTLERRYRSGKRGDALVAPDLRDGGFWRGKKRQGFRGKAAMDGTVVLR
jgi:hypothetical protein